MEAISFTHKRLIEDWVSSIWLRFAEVTEKQLSLPLPVGELVERVFRLRVDVESLTGRLESTSGVLVPRKRWIILNNRQSERRAEFTLAHELAHWLIETDYIEMEDDIGLRLMTMLRSRDANTQEKRADYLAGALLMPRDMLLAAMGNMGENREAGIPELADQFGVSHNAMRVRLNELLDGSSLSAATEPHIGRASTAKMSPKQKPGCVIIDLDSPVVDHTLLRKLQAYKTDERHCYLHWDGNADNEQFLELDVFDGVFVENNTTDPASAGRSCQCGNKMEMVSLSYGDWTGLIELTKPACEYASERRDVISYRGASSNAHKHLIDMSRYMIPSVELNYRTEAGKFVADARAEGKTTVIATGCFDLLTKSHVRFLRNAKAQGDLLIVGVEDDTRVRAFKGPNRPLNTVSQRVEVLSALRCVDFVFVIAGSPKYDIKEFYTRLHRAVQADILAVTEGDPYLEDRRGEIEAAGGELRVVSRYYEGSTTSLVRSILTEMEIGDLALLAGKQRLVPFVEIAEKWQQPYLPVMGEFVTG
jgi:rfaE bifunctional protein nucleotidyltransferase chain/domain